MERDKNLTLEERYADDILTDNTQFENCKQCKACLFRDDGTIYSNDYRKCSCEMFPYPSMKPLGVINNKENCEYRVTKG
jgi:hypothetical protein